MSTRPWKDVYSEHSAVERNWRRGRYSVRTLRGHTDGVMCLQFSKTLQHPSFPILLTGSYGRTVRVWNIKHQDWPRGALPARTYVCSRGIRRALYGSTLIPTYWLAGVWTLPSRCIFARVKRSRGHQDWVNSVLLWDTGEQASPQVGESMMCGSNGELWGGYLQGQGNCL
jgi:F-box/WD-40 domain protein MET30